MPAKRKTSAENAAPPIPPETEADNERLIQLMLEIDDAERIGELNRFAVRVCASVDGR